MKIMSVSETRSVMLACATITQPSQVEHSRAITVLKTKQGCLEWRREMACLERAAHLQETWGFLADPKLLLNIGLTDYRDGRRGCGFSAEEARRISTSIVNYTREILLRECQFLWSYCGDMPACFAALVSPEETRRAKVAAFIKSAFAAITVAEKAQCVMACQVGSS